MGDCHFHLTVYCVHFIVLGATSLQQPITGKVSTSLAGIQPIMNMNSSDLTVSTSSNASSSSDVVKVELNSSLAANFVMSSGMTSGMNSGMTSVTSSGLSTALTSALNSGMSSGPNTGLNNSMMTSGINTGMNAGMNTVMNTGMNPGVNPSGVGPTSTFSAPQSRLPTSMNPGMSSLPGMNPMHSGMSSGMNVGMSSGMNTGMNSGMNVGMGSGMSSAMGSGMSSGLGMPMNAGNQLPPLPSGNLTGMQQAPDVYSTPGGVGGAPGPPMMNQSMQAQTQVHTWLLMVCII